jgi:hypothetical protein
VSLKRTLLGLAAVFACNGVWAAQYRVTIQAQLVKDPTALTIFGIQDAVAPIQLTFVIDSIGITRVPAGTVINAANGASFAAPVQLITKAAITNFTATVGNQSFVLESLQEQPSLGATGLPYAVLIAGDLVNGAQTLASFTLNSNNATTGGGILDFGFFDCAGISCQVSNTGYAEDDIELGVGTLSNISAQIETLISDSTPAEQIDALIGSVKALPINNLPKAALLATLSAADRFIDKDKYVRAGRALDAFIVVVKAQRKKLGDGVANSLITQAQAILNTL